MLTTGDHDNDDNNDDAEIKTDDKSPIGSFATN